MLKKSGFLLFISLLLAFNLFGQEEETKKKLYDPTQDAKVEIERLVKKAEVEGKHVLLQVGGNWCGWCIAFDEKVKSSEELSQTLKDNFLVYHLNYSKENTNDEMMAKLGFPQRFGFPVFVVLDGQGNRLHTQNSVYLEEGKGHSESKVLDFFNHWSPTALKTESYEK